MTKYLAVIAIMLCLVSNEAMSTEQFADKTARTSDGDITVRLRGRRGAKQALIIEDSAGRAIKSYSETDLLPLSDNNYRNYSRWTTAGSDWYQNSIISIDKTDRYFAAYLRWGKLLVIDLDSKVIVEDIPAKVKSDFEKNAETKAQTLLLSDEADDRVTGSLFCGRLKIREAIPQLRQLLDDGEFHSTRTGDGPWKNVYYVRKAAKEALEEMNENVTGIIVEIVTGEYKPNRK